MGNEVIEGYQEIFNCSPSAMLILKADAPHYTVLDVNEAYLQSTHSKRELLIGKPLFSVFPSNPSPETIENIERATFSFEEAIRTKKPHTISNYRYDILKHNTNEFEERYWTTTNTPTLNEKGEVKYFIHSPVDVTELYKLNQKEKTTNDALINQLKQLYALLMLSPVGIAILK